MALAGGYDEAAATLTCTCDDDGDRSYYFTVASSTTCTATCTYSSDNKRVVPSHGPISHQMSPVTALVDSAAKRICSSDPSIFVGGCPGRGRV